MLATAPQQRSDAHKDLALRSLHVMADGMRWDVRDVIAEDDLVVVRRTARTGTTRSHWLRLRDGQVIDHWGNRENLGTVLARHPVARARRGVSAPRPFERWRGELDDQKVAALRVVEAMRKVPEELFGRFGNPRRLLEESFAELDWVVHHVVTEGDLAAVHLTVSGRQKGPVAAHDDTGRVQAVFAPTGRRFATTHTHWLRLAADGTLDGHWSDRDDLGMAMQLGWIPQR
jgi:hypothetical protein